MKITFIHHSSFCVEIEDTVFIFDYFNGNNFNEKTNKSGIEGICFSGKLPEINKNQKIYVFASHKHQDHFDMEILKWREKYSHIQYIFPKEMKFSDNYLSRHEIDLAVKEQIHYMKPNTELSLGEIKIETLKSTDAGVAFLVSYAGKTIYHAGDLHWWHWEREEKLFLQYQERMYKAQIDKLKNRKVDVAFVVLDPRLSESAFLGIDYFRKQVDADYIIPMHLWKKYEWIGKYKALPETETGTGRILEAIEENQIFKIC